MTTDVAIETLLTNTWSDASLLGIAWQEGSLIVTMRLLDVPDGPVQLRFRWLIDVDIQLTGAGPLSLGGRLTQRLVADGGGYAFDIDFAESGSLRIVARELEVRRSIQSTSPPGEEASKRLRES